MAYKLPVFNLVCNIKRPPFANTPAIPSPPYRLSSVSCQLAYGERMNASSTGGTGFAGIPLQTMNLQLPKLTDIRGPQDSVSFDMVEVPAGSGRWYWVTFVDDIGKGFTNEHRTAGIFALEGGWVAPYV